MASPRTDGFIALSRIETGRHCRQVRPLLLGNGECPHFQHQVEVGALDQLRGLNSEALHELTRFANADFGGFPVLQHDFELEKMAKVLDAVQVNAGTSNQEESAVFADATDLSIGQR